MKFCVYIPLTSGSITILSLKATRRQSAVYIGDNYRANTALSHKYIDFLNSEGELQSLLSSEVIGYELRLSDGFDSGDSWEVPLTISHWLLANGHEIVPDNPDYYIWSTGALSINLQVIPSDYCVSEKFTRFYADQDRAFLNNHYIFLPYGYGLDEINHLLHQSGKKHLSPHPFVRFSEIAEALQDFKLNLGASHFSKTQVLEITSEYPKIWKIAAVIISTIIATSAIYISQLSDLNITDMSSNENVIVTNGDKMGLESPSLELRETKSIEVQKAETSETIQVIDVAPDAAIIGTYGDFSLQRIATGDIDCPYEYRWLSDWLSMPLSSSTFGRCAEEINVFEEAPGFVLFGASDNYNKRYTYSGGLNIKSIPSMRHIKPRYWDVLKNSSVQEFLLSDHWKPLVVNFLGRRKYEEFLLKSTGTRERFEMTDGWYIANVCGLTACETEEFLYAIDPSGELVIIHYSRIPESSVKVYGSTNHFLHDTVFNFVRNSINVRALSDDFFQLSEEDQNTLLKFFNEEGIANRDDLRTILPKSFSEKYMNWTISQYKRLGFIT
mgnify:CR=1 FL=1